MAKIDVTKTELVWPGKYNEDGTRREVPRVSLPFQIIETVNESRATREAQKAKGFGLFDTYQSPRLGRRSANARGRSELDYRNEGPRVGGNRREGPGRKGMVQARLRGHRGHVAIQPC